MADQQRKLIDEIKPDVREVHEVMWPGTTKSIGLLMLRDGETRDAFFAAREHFAKRAHKTIDEASAVPFKNELDLQYCVRMLLEPGARVPSARLFKTAEEARARLDPEEREYFVSRHLCFQNDRVSSWHLPELEGTDE